MAYRDFKELPRKTVSGKVLHDKAFNIAKHPKCDGYFCGFASMVYKFIDKMSANTAGGAIKSDIMSNQLANELPCPITRPLKTTSGVLMQQICN